MTKKWCPSFGWSCFRNASISVSTALHQWFNKHCEVLFFHQNRELCHLLFLHDLHVDRTGQSSLHNRAGKTQTTALRKILVNDVFMRLRDGLAPAEA